MVEPIEIPFGGLSQVNLRNHKIEIPLRGEDQDASAGVRDDNVPGKKLTFAPPNIQLLYPAVSLLSEACGKNRSNILIRRSGSTLAWGPWG